MNSPLATNGIDLIDKDNARTVRTGYRKHLTDTLGPDADKHFVEFRTRGVVERNL